MALLFALPSCSYVLGPAGAPDGDEARHTPLSRRLLAMAAEAPICVGHRGASRGYPENTIPAFAAAVKAGAHMVELDFRRTADGVLVCLHDDTLDRTTDCERLLERREVAVSGVELAELRRLDAGSWKDARFAGTRVPTLEEALEVITEGSIAMVEHKAGEPAELVDLLRREQLVDDVLVQSFDWGFLERLHRLEPRVTIGALGSERLDAARLRAIAETGAALVHWRASDLRVEDVGELRRRGYLVCIYTVNSDLAYFGAAAIGIHAITTDRPGRLAGLLRDGRLRRPEPRDER